MMGFLGEYYVVSPEGSGALRLAVDGMPRRKSKIRILTSSSESFGSAGSVRLHGFQMSVVCFAGQWLLNVHPLDGLCH